MRIDGNIPLQASHTAPVWVLTDDRPGNVTQVLGVAEALGLPFRIQPLAYNRFAPLPNFMKGCSLLSIEKKSREQIQPPWPEVVIAAGRRAAPVARYIKQQNNGQTALVQLMGPGGANHDFDLIAVPWSDRIRTAPNVVRTLATPNKISPEALEESAKYWQPSLAHLPRPWTALLIGGNGKKARMLPLQAERLIKRAVRLTQEAGGSLLVTTSRRTPPAVLKLLGQHLQAPHVLYEYGKRQDNPYKGFLALADHIVVTGDSFAMISEACSTGKPVYVYATRTLCPKKHRHFHQKLFEAGYAQSFDGKVDLRGHTWQPKVLNVAKELADIIKDMLHSRHVIIDNPEEE